MINIKESIINYFRNLPQILKFNLDKNYHHLSIIAIACFIIVFNLAFQNASLALAEQEMDYYDIDVEVANKIISKVAEYTKFEEDLEQCGIVLEISANDEYICKDDSPNTEKSKLEREYVVQKGETISTIARKFDMHVASILDRNRLTVDEFEDIRAGQIIIIPSKDTSNSKQWLADLNYKKEQERLVLEKKRQEKERKRKLAAKKRSTYYRSSSSSSRSTSTTSSSKYSGGFSGGFSVPISHNGISRGLSRYHHGIDYRANVGTPVKAAAGGKVVGSSGGWGSGYGKSIVIDHGGGYTTRYAHLNSFAVSVGQSVGAGQVVGYSGNTGWSTGPHLHFETRVGGKPINPF